MILHQKIFNYRKKIKSIDPDHYSIALSLRINYVFPACLGEKN